MRMGGGAQQFGVDVEEVPRLLKETGVPRPGPAGFHVFSGSQNLHAEILVEAQRAPSTWCSGWPAHDPRSRRTSTSAAGSASPTTTRTAARPRRRQEQPPGA